MSKFKNELYSDEYFYINEIFSEDDLNKIKNLESENLIELYKRLYDSFIKNIIIYRNQ